MSDVDRTVTMVTSSAAKFDIAASHLRPAGIRLTHTTVDLPEIQSTSVVDIAIDKARRAYGQLGRPIIVEDSGFGLDELGGYPGALVKSLVEAAGIEGVVHLANLTAMRACSSMSALVYTDGVTEQVFTHTRTGTIAGKPEGAAGRLPLWTIYIPTGHQQPLATLPDDAARAWHQRWAAESVFAQFAAWHAGHEPAPQTPVVDKVICYIVRDNQLLVFRHLDYPFEEVGIQVPAGTIRPGEDPAVAALREGAEETSLTGLRIVSQLGVTFYDISPHRREIQRRHVFHLTIDGDVPARWNSAEDHDGVGEPTRFECFWIPVPVGHLLQSGQGALLSRLP